MFIVVILYQTFGLFDIIWTYISKYKKKIISQLSYILVFFVLYVPDDGQKRSKHLV